MKVNKIRLTLKDIRNNKNSSSRVFTTKKPNAPAPNDKWEPIIITKREMEHYAKDTFKKFQNLKRYLVSKNIHLNLRIKFFYDSIEWSDYQTCY